MFVVIYEFRVKDGMDEQFIDAWYTLTRGIYRNEGSLGSRLHRGEQGQFIAYAQWPDRETWEHDRGEPLSEKYEHARLEMRASLENSQVLYTLDMERDYLQQELFLPE